MRLEWTKAAAYLSLLRLGCCRKFTLPKLSLCAKWASLSLRRYVVDGARNTWTYVLALLWCVLVWLICELTTRLSMSIAGLGC